MATSHWALIGHCDKGLTVYVTELSQRRWEVGNHFKPHLTDQETTESSESLGQGHQLVRGSLCERRWTLEPPLSPTALYLPEASRLNPFSLPSWCPLLCLGQFKNVLSILFSMLIAVFACHWKHFEYYWDLWILQDPSRNLIPRVKGQMWVWLSPRHPQAVLADPWQQGHLPKSLGS